MNTENMSKKLAYTLVAVMGITMFIFGTLSINFLKGNSNKLNNTYNTKRYITANKILVNVSRYDSIRIQIKNTLNSFNITAYDSFLGPVNIVVFKKEIDSMFASSGPATRILGLLGLDEHGFIQINLLRVDTGTNAAPPGNYPNYKWPSMIQGSLQDEFPPGYPPILSSGLRPRPKELPKEYISYLLGL